MLELHVEKLSDLTVIECKGRIVHSDSVFQLRDLVQAQVTARVIGLDLSEVEAIGGGGLGMLAFLARWARTRKIQFKLLSPSGAVVEGLIQSRSLLNFEIAGFRETIAILANSAGPHSFAA